jgi:hypothetical protein
LGRPEIKSLKAKVGETEVIYRSHINLSGLSKTLYKFLDENTVNVCREIAEHSFDLQKLQVAMNKPPTANCTFPSQYRYPSPPLLAADRPHHESSGDDQSAHDSDPE